MKAALAAAAALAACASRPAVPILNYHAVGASDRSSAFNLTAPEFEQQLDWLVSAGYHTVSLEDVVRRSNLDHAVALTFDDGSDDALRVVLPELRKRGMKATFFIITGLVGMPGYLTWDEVRALDKAGMSIGSHTAHHQRLPELPEDRAREELAGSRLELERQLGHPVELLAYPYNALRRKTVALARDAGYRIAAAGPAHGELGRASPLPRADRARHDVRAVQSRPPAIAPDPLERGCVKRSSVVADAFPEQERLEQHQRQRGGQHDAQRSRGKRSPPLRRGGVR